MFRIPVGIVSRADEIRTLSRTIQHTVSRGPDIISLGAATEAYTSIRWFDSEVGCPLEQHPLLLCMRFCLEVIGHENFIPPREIGKDADTFSDGEALAYAAARTRRESINCRVY